MAYTKYSLTPANNNAAPPNGAPEGMLPSTVNDTMRDMMSQIRDVGDGIRGGTYTMTAPVITGGSISGVTITSPVITGGSINNTSVGDTTASTGAFTSITCVGSGVLVREAETQDGVQIRGRAGGTGNWEVVLTPTTLSSDRTVTLPDVSTTMAGTDATQTLTNKRITARVETATSSATPTINTDNVDYYGLTAQAVDITSFTTNLSGTPTDGQKLWIYIVGTATRTISWGSSFEESTATLPSSTVTTNRLDVGFVWNTATSKWRCVAVA